MRAQRSFQLYSIILLCLSTFVVAWPWPRWLPELDSLIVARADSSSSSSAADNTASASATTAPKSTNTASETGSSDSKTDSKAASKTSSGKDTATTSGSKSTSGAATSRTANSSSTTFNATYPPGGISLLAPTPISTTYFKIGDFITFSWNYTSLLATPTAVNIMATCLANAQLYTIATNQTVTASTQGVTWDTGAYQATAVTDPLLTQSYTLIIYDAASSITAPVQAGYLAVYNQFAFGMYAPQPYTPLSDWVCATCSGALSDMERKALTLMFGMGVVTVLSFTWFVTGLGVIW